MEATRIPIPSELFAPAESSHFEGTYAVPVVKAGPDLYDFAEPLAWQVDVTNTGDALLVTGTVEGEAKTSCARCVDEFSFPVTGEVEGYFLIGADREAPEDMDDDEFDVLPDDNVIDLEPLLRSCRCATRNARGSAPRAVRTSTMARAAARRPRTRATTRRPTRSPC